MIIQLDVKAILAYFLVTLPIYLCNIVQCNFFVSFCVGELCISVKIITVSEEMLFYKY